MPEKDNCKISVSTFDKLADVYAEKYFNIDTYSSYLLEFLDKLQNNRARVLDIACGPGNVTAFLAKASPELQLVGVDLAERMISLAKQKVPSATFIVEDCRQLRQFNSKFDAAIFSFGLSYISDQDANSLFLNLNNNLNPCAYLYLSTITGSPELNGFEFSSTGDRVYQYYRTAEQVCELVQQSGYEIEFKETVSSPSNASKLTDDLILIAKRNPA